MFNVIITLFLIGLGFLGFNTSYQEIQIGGIVIMCLGLAWLVISQINGFVKYSEQVFRFEKLKAQINKLENHREKTKDLLKEFKLYLAEKFPDLEMEFFKIFQENKSDTRILLAYPELSSHKTITQLVDKINELSNETYKKLSLIEDSCADIRYYNASKWELFKPTVPKEIADLL